MAVADRSNPVTLNEVAEALAVHRDEPYSVRALLVGATALLDSADGQGDDTLVCAMSLVSDAARRLDGLSEGLDRLQTSAMRAA